MKKLWILLFVIITLFSSQAFAATQTFYSYSSSSTVPSTARFLMYDGTTTRNVLGSVAQRARGTITNDNAAVGYVGEHVRSAGGPTSFAATNTYSDFTSISLTAGDWDVSGSILTVANGATVASWFVGISTTSGDSSTGLTLADNYMQGALPGTAFSPGASVVSYRISLASTTTVYLKAKAIYTVATPQGYWRISARRVR